MTPVDKFVQRIACVDFSIMAVNYQSVFVLLEKSQPEVLTVTISVFLVSSFLVSPLENVNLTSTFPFVIQNASYI